MLDAERPSYFAKMLKMIMKMRHNAWEKMSGKLCKKAHSWK